MQKATPTVSIVIPVYNAEAFLPNTLNALVNQTYRDFEIILINDGSMDSSGEICDSYAMKDSRIRVIHKANGGVSSARNAGIEIAQGSLIGFVDSDDIVKDSYIQELVENLFDQNADISICRSSRCTPENAYTFVHTETVQQLLSFNSTEAIQNALIGRYYGGAPWGCLLKRSLIENSRFDPELFLDEDLFFIIQAMRKANRVCYTRNVLYNYIVHPSGITYGKFNEKHLTLFPAIERITAFLKSETDYGSIEPYWDCHIVSMNFFQLRRMRYDKLAQKRYGPVCQKMIRTHLNRNSFSYLNNYARICAILSFFHYKLYIAVSKILSKSK